MPSGLPFILYLLHAIRYLPFHQWSVSLTSQLDLLAMANPLFPAWQVIRGDHPLDLPVSSLALVIYIQMNVLFIDNPFFLMDRLYDLWLLLRSTEIDYYLINGGQHIDNYETMDEFCMSMFI